MATSRNLGLGFRLLNGRLLQSVNWMNNKLNILPGLHLLYCALGASIIGGAGKALMDWLGGTTPPDGFLSKTLHPDPKDPSNGFGSLRVGVSHMPRVANWENFEDGALKEMAANDWRRNAARYIPALMGAAGVFMGSRLFFLRRHTHASVERQAENYDNMLTDQRRLLMTEGESLSLASAIATGATGGGSVRSAAGGIMTNRFIAMNGQYCGIPGLRRLLYGRGISGEFNMAGLVILDDLIVYLARVDEKQLDSAHVERAVNGILGPLFKEYTKADVSQISEAMIRTRQDYEERGDGKSMEDAMAETFAKNWDRFLEEHSGLKAEDAHPEGHGGGLILAATRHIPAFLGGKGQIIKSILDHTQERNARDRAA